MNWERVRERSEKKDRKKGEEAHSGEQEEKFKRRLQLVGNLYLFMVSSVCFSID